MSRLTFGLALLISMAVCSAADRIDPKLRALAATRDRLPVLIVLSEQPQRDIVSRMEEDARIAKNAARMRFEEAVSAPFSLPQDVSDAQAELDRITLEIRHGAIEEIQRTIQPQQDSLVLLLRSYGATNIRTYTVTNALSAEVPSAILPALEADADVAGVFAVSRLHPQLSISVPAIQAPAFWSAHSRGAGESVGVLDSGIMSSNPGFSGLNIVSHVSLSEGAKDPCFADTLTPTDNMGHGTHVSGIVASKGGGSCPTCIGVAPGPNSLYVLKVGWVVSNVSPCSGGGEADDGDVLDAIDWAVPTTPVNVLNFSYGGTADDDDDFLSQMLDQIGDAWGVNIVMAAGNGGTGGGVESPGISYNGVTVASMDDQGTVDRSDDVISSFSSRGPTIAGRFKPDISAPGNHGNGHGGILSTCNNGDFCQMAGTSMATPHVAGSLALIRSAGAQDGLAAKAVLLNTAYNTKSGWQADSGWGFVDLGQASAQVSNYFRASVSGAQPAFYAGTVNSTLKTTLVWNRHLTGRGFLTSSLSNLDLYAYDGASGNAIGSSTSTIQNVEQVVTGSVSTAVLKVVPVSIAGVTSEQYALAVSAAGFTAKNGPSLTVSCTGPSGSVSGNAPFAVTCSVTNTGDLTAFTVSGALNWQGSSGGAVNQFGSTGPGQQSGAKSWQMFAPSSTGQHTLETDVSSSSYGQIFTASTTVAVVVGQVAPAMQTYTLTTTASPSGGGVITPSPVAAGGVYAAGTQVCLTVTANPGWAFSSWSGAALDSSNCLTLNSSTTVTANFVAGNALRFIPMTPCRVVDTRFANGAFGLPSLAAGSTRDFAIPNGSCSIPSSAAAYSLNVTVVPQGLLGYLSVWPSGQAMPLASTLNSVDGRIKANAAIVPAGTGGAVSVYVTGATDLVLDIDGPQRPGPLSFAAVPHCRHPLRQLRHSGAAVAERGPDAQLRRAVQRLPCAGQRAGVFAELHRGAFRIAGLHHHVSHRATDAAGLHAERCDGHGGGQRGHRAGGDGRSGERVRPQYHHRSGDRHQRLLRAAGGGRIVAVQPDALPGAGHAAAGGEPAVQRREGRGRDRERLRGAGGGPGVCVQCDGGATRIAGLPELMAAGRSTAAGIDAECHRRRGHFEHGHCSRQQRQHRGVTVQSLASGAGCLRIFRAVKGEGPLSAAASVAPCGAGTEFCGR
jgi:subtilisin family serine protease